MQEAQGSNINDQQEEQELYQAMQAKKERFRVQIRATKNKLQLQSKRMQLANDDSNHFESNFLQNNALSEKDTVLLQQNVDAIAHFQNLDKEKILQSLKGISKFFLEGAYYQDIELAATIAQQLLYIFNLDINISELDGQLVETVSQTLVNITYHCDKILIKKFSGPELLDTLLRLSSCEQTLIRQNCFTLILNILNDDEEATGYLMKKLLPQSLLTAITTYGPSDQIIYDISSIVNMIVSQQSISYQEASEFLVALDELTDIIMSSFSGQIKEEEEQSLVTIFDSLEKILRKQSDVEQEDEDIIENFVIQFPRTCCHLLSIPEKIGYQPQTSLLSYKITRVIGIFLEGNIRTTQIVVENGVFQTLKLLIKHPETKVRLEATWSVSNLFVFTTIEGLTDYLRDIQFWEDMMNIALQDERSVSKWAYVSIMNAFTFENMEFDEIILQQFTENDFLKFIFESLQEPEYQDVLITLLGSLRSLIVYGDFLMKLNNYQENHIITLINRLKSKQVLEQLEKSYTQEVADLSSALLEKIY